MKKTIILLATILFSSTILKADETVPKKVIADCHVAATANEAAEELQISYLGGDKNQASSYSVHMTTTTFNHDFPIQELQWNSDKTQVGMRFANFIIISINNGQRDDNTIGVMLGAPANKMSCTADL